MKRYFFPYYRDFSCIAKDCPMICCNYFRIDFFHREESMFDTKREWQDIDGKGGRLRDYLAETERGWICRRRDDGGCIFFEDGLCGIQKRHGADAMPSVCRTYPRVITEFGDRMEFSLDPCCPVSVKLTENWNIGELVTEGEGPIPSSWAFLKRQKAFKALANRSLTLQDSLQRLADEYATGIALPEIRVSGRKEEFLRKATALLVLSDILPYEGYPTIDNIMGFILDFILGFVPELSDLESEDWWEMSVAFSRSLTRKVIADGFDADMEARYIDANDRRI